MGKKNKASGPPDWEAMRGEISPFKLAEKRYKRYSSRRPDLSAVLDPHRLEEDAAPSSRMRLVKTEGMQDGRRVVSIVGRDGLILLPGFIEPDQQLMWAKRCVEEYPEPPNKTNLTPYRGPICKLWAEHRGDFYALRWCTLGRQYDWTGRTYEGVGKEVMPGEVQTLFQNCLSAAGVFHQNVAEAAIVNYYGEKSTLGGHLDDVEPDQDAPIVSVSLGCPAVFLIGGASHDVEPDAILLRGGDVVVMSGSARRCLHGVPLVLLPGEAPEAREKESSSGEAPEAREKESSSGEAPEARAGCRHGTNDGDELATYLESFRININIRQVHSCPLKDVKEFPREVSTPECSCQDDEGPVEGQAIKLAMLHQETSGNVACQH